MVRVMRWCIQASIELYTWLPANRIKKVFSSVKPRGASLKKCFGHSLYHPNELFKIN